ncbi:MAG: hypothetical protein C0608_10260 [Deltaproteobacteria bacterium]|nr:MAG: hypothetical protein C0608_10260 [Deltaproteobacteria bacterium]
MSRKSGRIEWLSTGRPHGRGGLSAPTLVVALAVLLVALLIVANLLLERTSQRPIALTSSDELLSSVDGISDALRSERTSAKTDVEVVAKESKLPEKVPAPAKEEPLKEAAVPAKAAQKTSHITENRAVAKNHGGYAVRAGLFRSQRYLIALEREIDSVKVPHFREKIVRPGSGFRLTIEAEDAQRARELLEAHGYEVEAADEMVVAFYFVEKEAEKALLFLKENGVRKAAISPYTGDLPVWKLSCGPYAEKAEADSVAALLRKKKIVDAVVTKND